MSLDPDYRLPDYTPVIIIILHTYIVVHTEHTKHPSLINIIPRSPHPALRALFFFRIVGMLARIDVTTNHLQEEEEEKFPQNSKVLFFSSPTRYREEIPPQRLARAKGQEERKIG